MKTGRSSKSNRKRNHISNRIYKSSDGFSLVELVIVVAILAIVAGGLVLSASVVSHRRVTKCAEEIGSTIERTRVLTLGKAQNDVECVLTYDSLDNAYYAVIIQGGSEVSRRKVGEPPIAITVYFDNETAGYQLENIMGNAPAKDPSAGLHLLFNRSSGAFAEGTNTAGGVKKYCSKIVVSGSDREVEINTVGKTGKITVVK